MVSRSVVSACLLMAVGGCAGPDVVRELVEVPVVEYRLPEPPAELLAPFGSSGEVTFVSPGHPEAAICLTPKAAGALRSDITRAAGRIDAWRAWTRQWGSR